MTRDKSALKEIQQSWDCVEAFRSRLKVSAFASSGISPGSYPLPLANAAHNLPFIHAYGVLNDALNQLAKEGHFSSRGHFLGPLLEDSKNVLVWQDFGLIKTGASRRNYVAHRSDLLERVECWRYVNAVKAELFAWGVLT